MSTLQITNGRVIDIETGNITKKTLYIKDGKFAQGKVGPADQTLDVADAFLAPGFIDLHTHVFNHPLFRHGRLAADRIGVRQGVACVVDAGSSGTSTIDAFPQFVHATQTTKTYAFVNIGSPGLPHITEGHASRPEFCDLPGVVKALDQHDWLVGVKVLASASHTGSFGLEAVKLARKAAEISGKPLMLHIGNAPPLVDDVLDLLTTGDIVTHTFHGKVGGILGYRDKIINSFKAAIDRGVIVDIGHGRSSFSFRVCETALAQGMPVNTISSDLHRGNVNEYAISLSRTMNKLRALGMSFIDVIRAVTSNPANAIQLSEFGCISAGKPAHLTIFKDVNEPIKLVDAEGETRTAETQIQPIGVLVDGIHHDVSETL